MSSEFALRINDRLHGQVITQRLSDSNAELPFSARRTNLSGWRLTVEDGLGRLKWKYLKSNEECIAQPQNQPSRFYLGLPTSTETRADSKTLSTVVQHGALYHSQVQVKELGCWAADLSCIFFVTPMLIISWYITQATIGEAHAIELVNFILGVQNPDGGWPTYCGDSTTLMGTTLVYVALRLLGLPADEEHLVKARARLLAMGGAVYMPGWAKFWLALLGLYKWEGTDPYPIEMWLLPEWLPVSPWKWYLIPRQGYLVMSYLSTKQFTIPSNPLLDEIRTEIFVQPYDTVDFAVYRGVTLQCSREQRKSWLLTLLNWIIHNIWIPYFRLRSLVEYGAEMVWAIVEESGKTTNSLGSVSVDGFLNMVAFYCREGPDSKALRDIHDASREYLWMGPRGMQVMSIHAGHTWETAFALQAYAEAGLCREPNIQPATERAYKFLLKQQHIEDFRDGSACHFFSRLGGWPFSVQYSGFACSDCTGEALKAILMIERTGIARLSDERHLQLGVDNLIRIQNPSGGYSSFEPIRGSQMLEHLNGTEVFANVMIEYDVAECTSSCITALALYRERDPDYRPGAVSQAIDRGVQYIQSQQRPDGSWLASWGIAYCYGVFFSLEGLACVGLNYENSDAVRRGCDFIVKKQQADGGWGETIYSILTESYTQAAQSHTVQTAWVCLALMQGGYPDREPIRKGIQLMARRQRADGKWEQENAVGSGIVTCELLYHSYIYSFPIRAIAMYKARYGDEAVLR
ncbi:terpenoid cyclases/protein prenyltransferase alpha-alpha toroid [Aspergillus aurantiobrunneus]